MQPAQDKLAEDLALVKLSTPQFPVYSNVSAKPETDPEQIKKLLLEQITHSVRWVEILQDLKAKGVGRMLEFGSGKVLVGLVGRTLEGVEARSVTNPGELTDTL